MKITNQETIQPLSLEGGEKDSRKSCLAYMESLKGKMEKILETLKGLDDSNREIKSLLKELEK